MAYLGTIFRNDTTRFRIDAKTNKSNILVLFKNAYCNTQFTALFLNENPACDEFTLIDIFEVGNETQDVDHLMGMISLVTSGTWTIEIYAQNSYSNLVTSLADEFLLSGIVQVRGQANGVSPFSPNTSTVIDGLNPFSPISLKIGESYTCEVAPVAPLGYNFPSTGELDISVVGSDGWIEANYLSGLRPGTTNFRINALTDFFTLNGHNKWGTTDRFTDSLGGQSYADGILQDHYITIEIFMTPQSTASWATAVSFSLGSDFGGSNVTLGFTNWFMASNSQLLAMANYDTVSVLNYSPLNITTGLVWTSTSRKNTTQAYRVQNSGGVLLTADKVSSSNQYYFLRPIDNLNP